MTRLFFLFILPLSLIGLPLIAYAAEQARFETDPTAPIEINADRLDVYRNEAQAIFLGNVIAIQGPTKMTSHKAILHANQAGDELKTIRAEGDVYLISENGSQARGDWAEHNVEAQELILGGQVVTLTENGNKLRGTQLFVDMVTGKARLISADEQTNGTNRVRGILTIGEEAEK
ncbi:MAG: hypothetical protein OXU76_04945 [Alphaproteobacteria bacterium]|nr:hypothetical protein [Alphaproteobacteria bacterium]